MRIIFAAAACLFLAGCAHDDYAVVAGSAPPAVPMSKALWDCRYDVYYRWNMQQQHGGALVAGVVGGAVGGLAAGLLGADSGPMKSSDIAPDISACMASKGYTGTSEN